MKLIYRGISYEPTAKTIATLPTETLIRYRGSFYPISKVKADSMPTSASSLRFRGIAYTKIFQPLMPIYE
jgi:Domain of unknown function (DUF4278)